MIDNFKLIESLLKFDSKDIFYFLQLLQRKKENPDLPKSVRVIDIFYIDSIEKLQQHKERIISKCTTFKARAYINLNKRSYKKVALEVLKETARLISEETYKPIKNVWDTACGKTSAETSETKTWIIDVDNSDVMFKVKLLKKLRDLQPVNNRYSKVIAEIPTPNGYHFITKPFNKAEFNELFSRWHTIPRPDVHTNNPTILYAT